VVNFQGGNTPSIAEPLPFGLFPLPGASAAQFQTTDVAYDFALGGVPFLSGESLRGTYFRRQYIREFAPIRKDQFDNQQVPGEQSILGWWLRSQSNFQLGAGIQYLDTSTDNTIGQRYCYSEHMDTLQTPGFTSLLPASKSILSSANTNLKIRGISTGGTDYVLVADGAQLKRIDATGAATNYTMPGGITNIVSLTDDGFTYFFVDTTGIYSGALNATGVAATLLWNLPNASGANVISWVKGRLVAGLSNSVYELIPGTAGAPALPTPKFSHFNGGWVFTAVCEVPGAILVSGSNGTQSAIHKFILDTSGALPVLSSGVTAAIMPAGELIQSMYAYIGSFVGIGTSKAFRVATVDAAANLTYGPQIIQNSLGVQCVTGYDRFLFCGNTNNLGLPSPGFINPAGASTNSMLARIDLSQNTAAGGYPYALDLDSHNPGRVVDACVFGNTSYHPTVLAMSVQGVGVFITDTANLEPSGTLWTGRIRYNTLEAKHFKYLYLRTLPVTDGSIQVNMLDPGGGLTPILNQNQGNGTDPSLIGVQGNQQEWVQLQLNFTRGSTNHNFSPTLTGYVMRGLPGVDRQLLLTVPFSCHDFEMDKFGQVSGYDGYSYARVKQVEQLQKSGAITTFQDLNYGDANLVICESWHFEQQSNEEPKTSSAGRQDSNARGGYIVVQLRVVS